MLRLRRVAKALGFFSLVAVTGVSIAGSAFAGGYDTGERDWDFLFQTAPAAGEIGVRYIDPQRTLTNVANVPPVPGTTASVRETAAFAVARASVAGRIGDHLRCLGSYREPWEGHADYGSAWAGSFAAITQDFTSTDLGLTCAAGLDAGIGVLDFIGGVSYQQIDYSLAQNGGRGLTIATHVNDGSVGWRAGVAYEIPAYALRASLIYNSAIDYRPIGTVSVLPTPLVIPVYGSITMPQSVELKLQSGVAPGWLAFGALKWTDWSVDQNMFLCPVGTPVCTVKGARSALSLGWQDSWTVTVGAAHQFSQVFSLAPSLTWDQGASQGFTSQTDTWTGTLTAVFTPNKNTEIKIGGTAGIMTAGSLSTAFLPGGIPNPVGFTATFGNDFVYALNASAAVHF